MPHKVYIVDGAEWPSVTEVLSHPPKPWLEKWRDKWGVLAERKTACANAIGTKFHSVAERLAKGEWVADQLSSRLYKMANQFEDWRFANGLRVEKTELHVVSNAYKFHGTFDATGYLADKPRTLALFDWKTSSGIYEDMQLQLAAYAQAYKEQTGVAIKRGIIVHVSKDKPEHKLTVKEYTLNKRLLNKFLKRLREYREAKA